MSLEDHRGREWAWQQLMSKAAEDCKTGGEIKPATLKWPTADAKQIRVKGWQKKLVQVVKRRIP